MFSHHRVSTSTHNTKTTTTFKPLTVYVTLLILLYINILLGETLHPRTQVDITLVLHGPISQVTLLPSLNFWEATIKYKNSTLYIFWFFQSICCPVQEAACMTSFLPKHDYHPSFSPEEWSLSSLLPCKQGQKHIFLETLLKLYVGFLWL